MIIDNVKKYLDSQLPYETPKKYFIPNEVKNTILKYPNKKSSGFNLITADVTKCLPLKAKMCTTYFPLMWKFIGT